MKKYFYILLILLFANINVYSAPEKFIPLTINQPNGQTINCFASGDEFYNWIHDANGFTIIQSQSNGFYYYATKINGEIVTSEFLVNEVNPESIGLTPWIILDKEKIMQRKSLFDIPNRPIINKNKNAKIQASNQGIFNNIAIFIRFSDQTSYTDQLSVYENQFNSNTTASMYSYFKEVSYNKLSINTSFYPTQTGGLCVSYQDPNPRSYYSPYNATTNPNGYQNDGQRTTREHTLLANAVNFVSTMVPASLDIDNDDDGYIDNIAFFIQGTNDAWATLLWPHMWALYTQDVRINGKRVWNYNFLLQSWTSSSRAVSVLCHEMFHTLGSPDLYHYSYDGRTPVGSWDIMESDANPPQHMSAYMKWKYGTWISSIPEITKSGKYTLNPLVNSSNNCYKIKSPNSTNEFFVVEYRRKEGMFESGLPGTGMLVYRIDSRYGGNAGGPPDEVYLYRLNGSPTNNGSIGSANFSSETGRTSINDYSNPYSFLQDGSLGGLNIFSIGSAGSTISFRVNFGPNIPTNFTPANNSSNIEVKTNFAWSTSSGTDFYTIQISELSDFSVLTQENTNLTSPNITLSSKLKYNTKYYWRVNATNYKGTSDWSDSYSFTTTLESPILMSPSNTNPGISATPKFVWNSVNGGIFYEIQISSTSDFANIVFQKNDISFTFYDLSSVLTYLQGYYWRVRAGNTNGYGEWSEVWSFTVTPEKPVILSQTNTALLCNGENTMMNVITQGRIVQYQWMKDGIDIQGADKAIFNITNASYPTSGVYSCRLTNLPGSDIVYSKPILIYVITKTQIMNKPDTLYLNSGDAVFEVKAHTEGAPADYKVQIQWYKNGIALIDNSKFTGTKSSILSILNISSDDFNSVYSVKVTGKCGTSDSLSGYTISSFGTSLRMDFVDSLNHCKGEEGSFYVDVWTFPNKKQFFFQWYKGNVKLTDGIKYENTNARNLKIKNLDLSDIGDDYYLDITCPELNFKDALVNSLCNFRVNVMEKPVFVDLLSKSLTISKDKKMQLISTAKNENISYTWYKDNRLIPNQYAYILTIDAITVNDAGKYFCIARNICGETTSDTCVVTVQLVNYTDVEFNLNGLNSSYNIPNPFNDYTEIYFKQQFSGLVNLEIVNSLGEKVLEINNYNTLEGINKIKISSQDLMSTGVYFYSIKTPEGIIYGKINLLK